VPATDDKPPFKEDFLGSNW